MCSKKLYERQIKTFVFLVEYSIVNTQNDWSLFTRRAPVFILSNFIILYFTIRRKIEREERKKMSNQIINRIPTIKKYI